MTTTDAKLPIHALAAGVGYMLQRLCPARAGVPSWAAIALSVAGGGIAAALAEATARHEIRAAAAAAAEVLLALERLPHIVDATQAVILLGEVAMPHLGGPAQHAKLLELLERSGAIEVARRCAT